MSRFTATVPITLVTCIAVFAQLPPASQELADKARAANPERFQYALDQGARILPTPDEKSFYLLWSPSGSPGSEPLIATLHGSQSWASDEFFLWHKEAQRAGYGILALQWWTGDEAYLPPGTIHAHLRAALKSVEARPESNLLHGFSRGSSNLYAVAARDRESGDRYYAMFLANAGGASADYPPNVSITLGDYGHNIFSGTYWMAFCGGQDPNPDRDGCPAMLRTADWVGRYGGVTDLFLEDPEAGHGGFHQREAHIRAALDAFAKNLALRTNPDLAKTTWEVRRDSTFEIPGASTPNAGWVRDEVWLVVGTRGDKPLFRSLDGGNSSGGEELPAFDFGDLGYSRGEVLPRQNRDGDLVFYILGLAPPTVQKSAVFRFRLDAGHIVRDPAGPVYEGGPEDARFIGVPDITEAPGGNLRLTYVARGALRANSRTAISTDGGATFTPEFANPFGDLAIPNARPTDLNVDPAVLKLAAGGYLGVTMRGARLYLFTSLDGRSFVPSPQPAIEAKDLAPGATGLYDPTLVQLPDGRIYLYTTAGAAPNTATRVVRAELAPVPLQ